MTKTEPEGFADFWESDGMPSQAYLLECFFYNGESGVLVWRKRPRHHFPTQRAFSVWNARYAGTEVKTQRACGHIRTSIKKRPLYAHRIIWKLLHGVAPDVVDHINGDGGDNRLTNLRSVSQAQNARNSSASGRIRGVYKHSKFPGWYAQVPIDGKVKSKMFRTRDEAIAWRIAQGRMVGLTDRHLGVAHD